MKSKHPWPRIFPYVMSAADRAARLAQADKNASLRRQVEEFGDVCWLELSDAEKVDLVRNWERACRRPATRPQPDIHVIDEEM